MTKNDRASMTRVALRCLSLLLTAIATAAGLAHVFSLPHKIGLSAADYLTVQRIYRGWSLLGIAFVGALSSTTALAWLARRERITFRLTVTAAVCLALSLMVFFAYTFPANVQTANWTVLPADWEQLRRQWEYSHVVGAGLDFLALSALSLSLSR